MPIPNLSVIEKTFISALQSRVGSTFSSEDAKRAVYSVFCQAGEVGESGWVVSASAPTENGRIFGIFFGQTLAYIVKEPTKEFFEDLKHKRLLDARSAEGRY